MLAKIARMSLVVISLFTLAIFLPEFYWKAFEPKISRPFAQYSPVINDFVIMKAQRPQPVFYDSKGHSYSRSESDSLLPLSSARQLTFEGRFPDSLNGTPISLEEVRLNSFTLRISPPDIQFERIDLYPLLESQSGRVRLEMPDAFFRIGKRMEFITTATNTLDEELSGKFSAALSAEGFSYPASLIAGNPTTRKPFDEGYFILDSNHRLFHVKMVQGEPTVRPVPLPENLRVRHLLVQELSRREFYALLVSSDSRFFLISYDQYRLIELPAAAYDWQYTDARILGDLFYRNVMCYNDTGLTCLVSNREYQPIDQYAESWKNRYQQPAGTIAEYLFPFTLELIQNNSMYVGFYVKWPGWRSLAGIMFFLMVTLVFLRYRRYSPKQSWPEFVVVLLGGLFGFISILLFPPLRDKF